MAPPLKTHVIMAERRIEIEAGGPDFDRTVWFHGKFDAWGIEFFVELYRVTEIHGSAELVQGIDKREPGDYAEYEGDFEALSDALKPDGGFQTVGLDGEDYVVFMYPMSAS